MRTASCVLAALALLGLSATIQAQMMPRKGDWVRLSTTTEPDKYYEGQLVEEPGESIAFQFDDMGPRTTIVPRIMTVPRAEVATFEMRVTTGTHMLKGALIGAGFLATVALINNAATGDDFSSVNPAAGALAGGLWGGLMGAFFHKHEWRTVELHQPPAAPLVSWTAGEALVGVRLRF